MDGCVGIVSWVPQGNGSKLTEPRDATIRFFNSRCVIQGFPVSTMIGCGVDDVVKSLKLSLHF
jgi:hypothetical protein